MTYRRLRVLSLDGGGVRGLSSLYILRKLLCMVNEALHGHSEPMRPQDVFDIFVGTSTGGLIALLIVKLGMTVDECIEQYEMLSKEIFGRPHFIGSRTGGFGTTKYSGRKMRELVVELIESRSKPADYKMEDAEKHPDILCSVVCRELENNYTRARRQEPVFLCSHKCRKPSAPFQTYPECEMADAARATSAAPTFFDPVRIMKKILVDGGYGNTNNPSFEAYTHYEEGMAKEILGTDRVRWVNIGTGTSLESSTDQFTPPKREWKDLLLPNYVLRIIQTISDLEKIATDSERTAHMMRTLSNVDKSKLDYHRFSATNGVHGIRLDDYRAIDNKVLEQKTKEYLEDPNVEAEMRSLAKLLAEDYEEKFRLRGPRLEMEDPPLSPRPSSIRRIVTGQQPEVLDLLSPGAGVPSMAGASEATAETSDVNETPRSRNAMPDGRVSIALLQTDRTGVGDQFKIPDPTATDFDPPTRASTAPASV